jgi:hypothetical protein
MAGNMRKIYGLIAGIDIERFWSKVDRRGDNECWNWKASKHWKGYGYINLSIPKKNVYSHRFSWVLHYGDIPDGMFVCHKCDNGSCCNPQHLFLGTDTDNKMDMWSKNRLPKGERAGQSKLTNDQVLEARQRYISGESYRSLARHYALSNSSLLDVLMLRSYKDAPIPDIYYRRRNTKSGSIELIDVLSWT